MAAKDFKFTRRNAGNTSFEIVTLADPGADKILKIWADGTLEWIDEPTGGIGDLLSTNNLSDLDDASDARDNLGLGDSATQDVGTGSGTVAAGNDSRITGAAQKSANLIDLADAETARTNLGLGTAATFASTAFAAAGSILTSLLTMATARIIGRSTAGTGAPEEITIGSGLSLSGGVLSATGSGSGDMIGSNNLSDVASASTSRTNLGLGNSATKNVGTSAGTVAEGDDSRIVGALQSLIRGKSVFVDGSGAAATDTRTSLDRHDESKPFVTISAAITAAASGETVIVLPGTYAEKVILKTGVNLHFFNGAKVSFPAAANNDCALNDNNAAVVCFITGFGEFEVTDAGNAFTGNQGLRIQHASTVLKIQCKSIKGADRGISQEAAATIEVWGDVDSGTAEAIRCGGGTQILHGTCIGSGVNGAVCTAGTQTIYGNVISTGRCAISSGGTQNIYGNVTSTGEIAASAEGGTQNIYGNCRASASGAPGAYCASGAQLIVGDITSSLFPAAYLETTGSGTQELRNGTLTGGTNKAAVEFASGTTTKTLRITNCTLIPNGTAPAAIAAAGAQNVRVSHCRSTLVIEGTNVTNLIDAGFNVVDTSV